MDFPSAFTATPFSVTMAVTNSAGVTSKLGLYIPLSPGGVNMTCTCLDWPSSGYKIPRTRHASIGGRCSIGMLSRDNNED